MIEVKSTRTTDLSDGQNESLNKRWLRDVTIVL